MSAPSNRRLIALVDQAITSLGAFAVTATFIRCAGIEAFGVVSVVWLSLLFATGLQQAVFVAPPQALLPKLEASTAAVYRTWLARLQVVFVLGVLAVVHALDRWTPLPVLPAELGFWTSAAFVAARLLFNFTRQQALLGPRGPRHALPLDLAHTLLSVGSLAALGLRGELEAGSGLVALAISSGVCALLGAAQLRRLGVAGGRPGEALRRGHWQLSGWMASRAVAQWFTSNAFLAALGALQGPAALGAVRAAQSLVGLAGVILQAFENVFPPAAARAVGQDGPAGLRRLIRREAARWLMWLLGALAPLAVFTEEIAHLLLRWEGEALRPLVLVFSVGALLAFAVMLAGNALRAQERFAPLFVAQLVAGLLGAAAAAPVVARYGMEGCVAGILLQQAVVLVMLLGPAARSVGSSPRG